MPDDQDDKSRMNREVHVRICGSREVKVLPATRPPEVIMVAVRWYLHAPRGALSYPQLSWEELEGRFLGPMAYLDAKARGNSSLPEKQRSCSGV